MPLTKATRCYDAPAYEIDIDCHLQREKLRARVSSVSP
jgi:hypothetical protein